MIHDAGTQNRIGDHPDPDQFDRTGRGASGPAINPEIIITDHGKIYVSDHLNSVCRRLGISIQPARVRVGRDKGPLERFFGTVREGLLQYLPGYKGPDRSVLTAGIRP